MSYFSDLKTRAIGEANARYNQFVDHENSSIDNKKVGYLGCGSLQWQNHIYLTLLATLPVFDDLAAADKAMIDSTLATSPHLGNYNLNNELQTPEKALRFFAKRLGEKRPFEAPEAFIFQPERLDRLLELLKDIEPQKVSKNLIKDMLAEPTSKEHQKLLSLTVEKLNEAKEAIVKKNWKEAKSGLRRCHFIEFVKLLFRNIFVKIETRGLIHNLKRRNKVFRDTLGESCGVDQARSTTMTLRAKGLAPSDL